MVLMFWNVSEAQVVNGVMNVLFNQSFEDVKTKLSQSFPVYSIKLNEPWTGQITVTYSIDVAGVKYSSAEFLFNNDKLYQVIMRPEDMSYEQYQFLVKKYKAKYLQNREIVSEDNIIPYHFFCGISKGNANCYAIRIGYSYRELFVSYSYNASESWGVYIKQPAKTIRYNNF